MLIRKKENLDKTKAINLPKKESVDNKKVETYHNNEGKASENAKTPQEQYALKDDNRVSRSKSTPKNSSKNSHKRKSNSSRELQLVARPNMPFSYVEAYKSLRTNIKFMAKMNKVNSFVITSAVPQESKTNMAINLAITLAEDGSKVVLVDADLRKPIIHKYLKISRARKGLTNAIISSEPLSKSIVSFTDLNIDVLVAGSIPPNPSELLASDRMSEIIDELKEKYDFVIVDAPPVSVVTDAAVIGTMVDGAILVVRSKFADAKVVKLAKKKLEDVNVKIFGVVLTRYNAQKSNKYNAYSYSYGYDYYKE